MRSAAFTPTVNGNGVRHGDRRCWFDFTAFSCDKTGMKAAKHPMEKKTAGTLAVEKYRPLMNKLSKLDRRRLRRRASEMLYGS
jgi:hypothetical protein